MILMPDKPKLLFFSSLSESLSALYFIVPSVFKILFTLSPQCPVQEFKQKYFLVEKVSGLVYKTLPSFFLPEDAFGKFFSLSNSKS